MINSAAQQLSYTIVARQTDTDGISMAANPLALNNGTLKDGAGNDAVITHADTAVSVGTSYLVESLRGWVALGRFAGEACQPIDNN